MLPSISPQTVRQTSERRIPYEKTSSVRPHCRADPRAAPDRLRAEGGGRTRHPASHAGVEATTASCRAPDVYANKGVDGSDMDWTITRFALLDLDGDGADELVLAIDYSGEEEYVILTCYDGAVYANQVVHRGFLSPKADGTFEWSNGAFDNGESHARNENGV